MNNQTQAASTTPIIQEGEGEVNFMDLLLVVAKYNRFIIMVTLLAAVLSIIYVMQATRVYTAKTVILPPQQESSASSALLASIAGGMMGGGSSMAASTNQTLGVMASRTLADAVIQRYNLQSYYKQKSMTQTRSVLWEATKLKADKAGFITLQFSDTNPRLAATIANAFVEELVKLNYTFALTNASRRRLFLENQVTLVRQKLGSAELEVKQMQEKTGMIALDKQTSLAIQGIANLRSQIVSREADLSAMHAYATERNPSYQQLKEVIAGLRIQLRKLEQTGGYEQGSVMVPTGKLPEKGLQFARAMRGLAEQEAIYAMLSKQLEAARIDEAKDAVLIQVIDRAVEPEFPSKPVGLLVLIISTVLGFVFGVIMSFVREASSRKGRDPASQARKNLFLRYIRRGR
jgi:uncharacterized protein involved in exopolysaccharide biosynthesis